MKTKILRSSLKEICHSISKLETDTILLMVDEKVNKLYGKKINIKGKKVYTYLVPQGEKGKTFAQYEKCMDYFLSKGIHRQVHLVAIGGGVTSDLAGFVASTLLRGISWSVVPTTLLSMVDASIGGKTGINSRFAKNQIGTFHFPQWVWLDYGFLKTLSEEELVSGKGEILKYSFLSKEIGNFIDQKGFHLDLIEACAELKLKLVKLDPFETKGKRVVLNLGHSFGHAFEKMWKLPHGIAVACGIGEIFRLFDMNDQVDIWHNRMQLLGFDLSMDRLTLSDIKKVLSLMQNDKKKGAKDILHLIVPSSKSILVKEVYLKELEENFKDLHGYT